MLQRLPLALAAVCLIALTGACASYNQEPTTTPAPSPVAAVRTAAATASASATAAAASAPPVQTATSQATPLPSSCPPSASPAPASIPGVPSAPAGAQVVTTPSGLQYIDLAPGSGPVAQSGQTATVQYTGWLVDGKKFDSSRDRNQPFNFPLGSGQVIKGWDEGVAGMHVNGQRRLIVPANLGYGPRGGGGVIPPCATLVFDVELLGVK